jgi:hypothetical protein
MHPFHLFGTELRMGFIQLYALYIHVLHTVPMMHLGPLGRYALKTVDSLEIHGTDVRCPRITDAPALTFQQLYDRLFWELTAGHQGALPFGELLVACGATQPFDMLVCTCPGPMRDVAFAGTIEVCALGIRARKARISLWGWRR